VRPLIEHDVLDKQEGSLIYMRVAVSGFCIVVEISEVSVIGIE
jgi:hypothetical protein